MQNQIVRNEFRHLEQNFVCENLIKSKCIHPIKICKISYTNCLPKVIMFYSNSIVIKNNKLKNELRVRAFQRKSWI